MDDKTKDMSDEPGSRSLDEILRDPLHSLPGQISRLRSTHGIGQFYGWHRMEMLIEQLQQAQEVLVADEPPEKIIEYLKGSLDWILELAVLLERHLPSMSLIWRNRVESRTLSDLWNAPPANLPIETDGVTPLITEYGEVLGGRVFHGGYRDGVSALTPEGEHFDLIVSLFPSKKYEIDGSKTARLEMPFLDGGELDMELVRQATSLIAVYLRRGGNVLIHCQMGQNRSGFVLAALLIEHAGLAPEEAIREIRRRRSPNCLWNGAFERQLLRLR